MKSHFLFLSLAIFCSIFSVGTSVNITEWEEGPCTRLPLMVVEKEDSSESNDIDDGEDVVNWYTPLWHKYELYQSASLVSGIPVKDLTDDDIKRSCLVSKMDKGAFYTEGFGGKQIEIVIAPGKLGGYLWKVKGDKEYRGEFWVTLFAKDFLVTVTCWADGHHSFSAASKTKTFDAATEDKIIKHVTSLGFDPKNIYEYSYDGCPDV